MHLEVEKNLNLIKGKCLVKIAALSSVQVVAGKKYIFELVQSHGRCGNNEESRCHIEVLSQPWLNNTEILTDEMTCTRE